MEEERLSIKLEVADRYYPLKIAVADEEKMRKAADRIKERVAQYRNRYPNRDMQDALAMTALQFIIKLIEQEESQNVTHIMEGFVALDNQIEEYLQTVDSNI